MSYLSMIHDEFATTKLSEYIASPSQQLALLCQNTTEVDSSSYLSNLFYVKFLIATLVISLPNAARFIIVKSLLTDGIVDN